MEIRAKCKFDRDTNKAVTLSSLFRKSNPKKKFVIWSIVSSVLVLIIILEMIIFSDASAIKLLCLPLMTFLLQCYVYFIFPIFRYKALGKLKETENEYIFSDNTLEILTKSEKYNGEAEIEYSLFVKVYETKKYFFLYSTNNQVFPVDKSTIEGGTQEDIRNKLSVFVKNKYIICKY